MKVVTLPSVSLYQTFGESAINRKYSTMLRRNTAQWSACSNLIRNFFSHPISAVPLQPLLHAVPVHGVSPSSVNHQLIPIRTIIMNTRLKFVDNSDNSRKRNRLDRPYCIKLLKNSKVGKFGDIIKIAHRGKVHNAMVISNRMPSKWLPRYDHHHIILLNEKNEPVGTRIHGPVPSALRRKEGVNSKIIAMATRFI